VALYARRVGDYLGELVLHVLVALPLPVLLFFAARRMRTAAGRGLLLGLAGVLFPALFIASYSFFCATCE
jgi:hypothetical protein